MTYSDWKREPPPPEAYSRVTNPERFAPLHSIARTLLERLAAEYDVTRTEVFSLLPNMQAVEHAHPPITVTPLATDAAPISIAFTTFPGVVVQCGLWLADSFPSCGCDACAETAADEGQRLEGLFLDVVAGCFREELTIPWFGKAKVRWVLGDIQTRATHRWRSGGQMIPRARARALAGGRSRKVQWQAWRRRGPLIGAPPV